MAWFARCFLFILLCLAAPSFAALDPNKFTRSQQLHSDFLLRWSIEDGQIRIGIEAATAGWVGFGITEAGGMKGADIVYFEVGSGSLVDAHALEYSTPLVDVCQDWELLSSSIEGGMMILEAARPLKTDDNEDWELVDDSETQQGHAFIAAWGDSESISFHGEKRASGRIRLFGNAPTDRLASVLAEDDEIVQSAIVHTDNPIPARKTTYDERCFDLQDALGMNDTTAAIPRHVVAYEAVLSPATQPYVHHFVVYGYMTRHCSRDADSRPLGFDVAASIVMAWAPGTHGIVMPSVAGLRILGADGVKALMVQTHYNNPGRVEGLLDSSGLKIYHTPKLRQHDIAVMQIGDPLLYLGLVQERVAAGWSKRAFECDKLSAAFQDEEVTVFSRFLHMHQQGERMEVRQMRGAEEVRRDSVEVYDFEQSGGHDPVSTGGGFAVRKGDRFEVDCYYSNTQGKTVSFGMGSEDEMCIDYLFYYPRQPLQNAGSCYVLSGNGHYRGEETYEDVHGTGRVFGLACDGSEGPEGNDGVESPSASAAARLSAVLGFRSAAVVAVVAAILSLAMSATAAAAYK